MSISRLALTALAAGFGGAAIAQTSASATITLIGTSGGNFTYDMQLNNAGTTGIQTFWFSWVPGANFMPNMPSAAVNPSGWTDSVISGGSGYSIQWKTSGGLNAGGSLDGFQFTSVDSLAVLEGNSGTHPILTSFVYSGQPFNGTSDQFVVTPAATPEPASWLVLAGGTVLAIATRRRR